MHHYHANQKYNLLLVSLVNASQYNLIMNKLQYYTLSDLTSIVTDNEAIKINETDKGNAYIAEAYFGLHKMRSFPGIFRQQ